MLTILAATFLFSALLPACSCGPRPTLPVCELFSEARAVFLGTVAAEVPAPPGRRTYFVHLEAIYRGIAPNTKYVLIDGSPPCGGPLDLGERYLIYTGGSSSLLHRLPESTEAWSSIRIKVFSGQCKTMTFPCQDRKSRS